MNTIITPLVDWGNGIIMIAIFAVVVITLVVVLVNLMNSGKAKDPE